jgi:NTE family protein
LIAVNVTPIRLQETKSMKDVLIKSLYLAINQTSATKFAQCQLVIDPPELRNFEGFEIKKAQKLFDIGYEATQKQLEKQKSEISLMLEISQTFLS